MFEQLQADLETAKSNQRDAALALISEAARYLRDNYQASVIQVEADYWDGSYEAYALINGKTKYLGELVNQDFDSIVRNAVEALDPSTHPEITPAQPTKPYSQQSTIYNFKP